MFELGISITFVFVLSNYFWILLYFAHVCIRIILLWTRIIDVVWYLYTTLTLYQEKQTPSSLNDSHIFGNDNVYGIILPYRVRSVDTQIM